MRRPPAPLAALAAGLLLAAALPPFGWWPLAVAGVALLDAALEGADLRRRALAGAVAGGGFLAPGLWWMTEFHLVGWVAALAIEVALFAVGAVLVAPGRGRWLALPGALVLAEALRHVVPFGGVPIATVAQTQVGGPLLPVLRLGGPLLLAAAVGGAGVAVSAVARRTWRPAAVAAAAVVALAVGGVVAPAGHDVGTLDVALVQGGGERGTRAINTDEGVVFRRHLDAVGAVRPPVDLVLWPEDVVDVDGSLEGSREAEALAELASAMGATVVAGVVESGEERFRNASVAWSPDGEVVGRYEKVRRVPFGEYVPLRSFIEALGVDLSVIPRDAVPGDGPGILRTPAGDLGVVISYEVFFPDRADAAVEAGGQLLLFPTNAASYSTTQMPALTLAAARMRAVETGRAVLQAAPTGFTALVAPDGTVRERTDLGARAVLQGTAPLRRGRTPYTVVGDAPAVVAAAAAVAAGWARQRRGTVVTPRAAASPGRR